MFFNAKFVSHYVPALIYKKTKDSVAYSVVIDEETHLNDRVIKNTYTQDLLVRLRYRVTGDEYLFDCQLIKGMYTVDETITQQGKLLESLAAITEQLELTVSEKGFITAVNYDDIIIKWKALKGKLLKTHKGKQSQGYINGIDARMKDKSLFLEELKQVKLFGLLFNGYQTLSEKDKPRLRKIRNSIDCLSVIFEEKVMEIKEDKEKQEKHITIEGKMQDLSEKANARIRLYLSYFTIGIDPVFLSNYKQYIVLDLSSGYVKTADFAMELINGRGYVRKMNFNIRTKNNG